MSFFKDLTGGNPFGTQVGQLIDQATDSSQASENWGLLMEICDIVNETEDGPRDAIKAIKKKLNMSVGKNYTQVMYTLTVLETGVKNCGKRFHVQVASKDFMQEMVKVIGPKNDPPQVVQEKVLSLIQTWADAFSGSAELKEVNKIYMELKNKGIEFPMTDLDAMAPIYTPARTTNDPDPAVVAAATSPHRAASTRGSTPAAAGHQPSTTSYSQRPPSATVIPVPPQFAQAGSRGPAPPPATGPVLLNQEQLAKLKSELDLVTMNCKILGDMLTELTPGAEEAADRDLRQDLNRTCRQMQQRIVEMLNRVQNEDVTCELLRVNDELNNVFLRYDRFERLATGAPPPSSNTATQAAAAAAAAAAQGSAGNEPAVANLIDLATPSPAAATTDPFATSDMNARMGGLSVGGSGEAGNQRSSSAAAAGDNDDDFDMFAQSRQSFDQSRAAPPSYESHQSDLHQGGLGTAVSAKNTGSPSFGQQQQQQDAPNEYDEMAEWLKTNPPPPSSGAAAGGGGGGGQESATSSEFDRFLAERAKEADTLPDLPAATGTTRPPPGGTTRPDRQIQKDDDNALFAL